MLEAAPRLYISAMFNPAILHDRSIIEVSGPEARPFLQGLVTNDVMRVSALTSVYAALLTPQGKIIYDFLLAGAPDGVRLDCHKDHAAELIARLKKYRLRAKLAITDASAGLAVVALPSPAPSAVADPRLAALGYRAIIPNSELETWTQSLGILLGNDTGYHEARIKLGVPDSRSDIPPETCFPLDCNFEELHGVDFNKGCYVGQELTSRMKHRATARRRMLPVSALTRLPAAGTPLRNGTIEIGEMRGSIHNNGLALIRLDRLASTSEVTIDGTIIHIGRPAYSLILTGAEPE